MENESVEIAIGGLSLSVFGWYEKAKTNADGFPMPATFEITEIYLMGDIRTTPVYKLLSEFYVIPKIEEMCLEKLKNK